jgi:hypothetical protein
MRKSALLALALALAACVLDPDPDVGPELVGNACQNVDSDPSVNVSFSANVRPLLSVCSCHQGRPTSGFDLSSFESLFRGGLNSGARTVVAGDPCKSIVVQKLSIAPPFGSRMPFNGPPYFTELDLQVVRDWIVEGAHNN